MDVVLVMFRDDQRRDFPMSEKRTILGRRQDCHLRIPRKDVSRQHCALLIQNETLIVEDLGSSNGTFVNDKRIAETELKPGDRLRLGPVTFAVQIDGEPASIKPEDVTPSSLAEPTAAAADDEKTFDLGEEDLDLDDPISALGEQDEEDDTP